MVLRLWWLQKSPGPGSLHSVNEHSLSSSPSHLEQRGSLRRRSSRGSTDSGARGPAGSAAPEKGWSLSRKFSIGKSGK